MMNMVVCDDNDGGDGDDGDDIGRRIIKKN